MSFISHDFRCKNCSFTWDTLVRKQEQDNLLVCPKCEMLAGERTIATPRSVMQKAAYPMGTKRKGFQDAKEALTLEAESYNKPWNERGELQKEIQKLNKVDK